MEAPEEVMLDVNELAKGHTFTSRGPARREPRRQASLAYTVDFTGYRQYTLHVKDLASGELARETAPRVTSLAWAADSTTIFYVEEDEVTKRSYRLHRMTARRARRARCSTRSATSTTTSPSATRGARRSSCSPRRARTPPKCASSMPTMPTGELRVVEPRHPGHEYYVDHHGDELFIRTNDKGANFRLVHAPVADPSRHNWKQVVAHRPLVMLEEV